MIPFKTKVARATGPRWVHLMVALVPAVLAAPAGAQLQEALTAQVQVDRDAAAAQAELNGIRERTQDAAGRYAQAMADAESLERFNAQLAEQVQSQEEEIASIEKQLLEIETTNREVQPLMQQMVDTLVAFVELDVPFLLEERTARVQNLKDIMPRADVTISEKYRRSSRPIRSSSTTAARSSAYEGRLGTGADARTVEFAQLGRVSLMYRTLDGSETGYWDADQKDWVVDHELSRGRRGSHSRGASRRRSGFVDRACSGAAGGAVVIRIRTLLPVAAVALRCSGSGSAASPAATLDGAAASRSQTFATDENEASRQRRAEYDGTARRRRRTRLLQRAEQTARRSSMRRRSGCPTRTPRTSCGSAT